MAHDSYFCKQFPGLVYPYLSRRRSGIGNFVGAIITNNNSVTGAIPFNGKMAKWQNWQCPKECRPRGHRNWKYC